MSSEQSNVLKRHEQKIKWLESDTDKASSEIKEAEKVQFTKEVQFLSACNNNDWDEIERLLDEGIDVNSSQDDGLTSLHQACIDDDENLVKYLIEHGADIDAQDKEGWTPLFAAISCNYLQISKYLVSHGARLDIVSFDGELPLDQSTNDTMSKFIKEEMKIRQLDPQEIRNRERNIMLKDVEYMKLMNDFSKFTLVDHGGSMLHISACKDYMDVLDKLLEILSPAQLNHVDMDGWTALHVAAHWGNRKACVMLINADIDFDKVTNSNQTVLEVSDDNVKPYIREEIRKARFRRQEKISIKRPAEPSNPDYQPSDTKIICQEKPATVPAENQKQESNGDKHVTASKDVVMVPINDDPHKSIMTCEVPTDSAGIIDLELKPNADDTVHNKSGDKSLANSKVALSEPVPDKPVESSGPIVKPEDTAAPKVVPPVLTPSKVTESESQRKDKARHVRSTRRSTQGVSPDDIAEAQKIVSVDPTNTAEIPAIISKPTLDECVAPSTRLNRPENEESGDKTDLKIINTESNDKSINVNGSLPNQATELPNISISNSENDTSESLDKKVKTSGHVVNKRRTRDRPPTGIIDPKDIQAAQQLNEPAKLPTGTAQKEPDIDYKALYENELKEMEKLNRNLARLRRELDQSEDKVKSLQNNHVVPKSPSMAIITPGCDKKEIEKLRDDNKKMKEANSALIRVISRLSHPPSKSLTSSN